MIKYAANDVIYLPKIYYVMTELIKNLNIMIESINKFAKVGLVHFMAFPSTIKGDGPIEETIRKVALDIKASIIR